MFSVSVRELIEFVLRRGDLGGERDFVGADRALAGIRGHQRIQRTRPAGYQKEISVSHELVTEESILRIHGRIDGLLVTAEEVLLEEIKTVRGAWDRVADPLHWAQAKFYGFIYSHDHALETITVQLTYLDLETGELTEFRELFSRADLAIFSMKRQPFILNGFRNVTAGASNETNQSERSPSLFRAIGPVNGNLRRQSIRRSLTADACSSRRRPA